MILTVTQTEALLAQLTHPDDLDCPNCDKKVLQIQVWKGLELKGVRYYHQFWNGEDEVQYCDIRH